MFSNKEYTIVFSGLKLGKHRFNYKIGSAFFEAFEFGIIQKGELKLELEFEKKSTMMVAEFSFEGTVEAECGICLDPVKVPISATARQIIKFGDEDLGNEEIMVIPHNAYEVDLTQCIYEFIHLALPSKIEHEQGECNQDMIAKLNELARHEDEEEVDPRWQALKDIKFKS